MKQGPVLVFPSEEPFFGKKELRRAFPVFQVYRVKNDGYTHHWGLKG